MTPAERRTRKARVFHITYGIFPTLTAEQESALRMAAAEYINGHRDTAPMVEDYTP